ncbi:MAG: lytic murein transglycosylase [Desulfobacterales bacterium]|nr:lytic murein transglycosylase [Desulfobacterales bacterium]MDX2509566.1 lytic murein transglycosylase [Desulfobacterales bacterium]
MPRTRKNRNHILIVAFLILIVMIFAPACAFATTAHNNYFESLQDKLITDGFDEYEIKALYIRPEVSFETKGVSLFFMHSEARLDYDQYTVKQQIKKARRYMKKYNMELSQAQKIYGVDKEVITAIILIETQCGTLLGNRSVLNTLSTLASLFDLQARGMLWKEISDIPELSQDEYEKKAERKSKWAYRELKAFLEHTTIERVDPVEIKGSYAGAMGISQFMPSNIPTLAKDGNNDGSIDLFNHADAIASIAFFLKHHGWKPGISKKKAQKVVHHYNHSDKYVYAVLKIAKLLKG